MSEKTKSDTLAEIKASMERQSAMLKEITDRLNEAETVVRKMAEMLRGDGK